MGKYKTDKKCLTPDETLNFEALHEEDITLKCYYYNQWLEQKQSKLFNRKNALGNNYLAVSLVEPPKNKSEPNVYYFETKDNLLNFLSQNPQSLHRYRYFERMHCMF